MNSNYNIIYSLNSFEELFQSMETMQKSDIVEEDSSGNMKLVHLKWDMHGSQVAISNLLTGGNYYNNSLISGLKKIQNKFDDVISQLCQKISKYKENDISKIYIIIKKIESDFNNSEKGLNNLKSTDSNIVNENIDNLINDIKKQIETAKNKINKRIKSRELNYNFNNIKLNIAEKEKKLFSNNQEVEDLKNNLDFNINELEYDMKSHSIYQILLKELESNVDTTKIMNSIKSKQVNISDINDKISLNFVDINKKLNTFNEIRVEIIEIKKQISYLKIELEKMPAEYGIKFNESIQILEREVDSFENKLMETNELVFEINENRIGKLKILNDEIYNQKQAILKDDIDQVMNEYKIMDNELNDKKINTQNKIEKDPYLEINNFLGIELGKIEFNIESSEKNFLKIIENSKRDLEKWVNLRDKVIDKSRLNINFGSESASDSFSLIIQQYEELVILKEKYEKIIKDIDTISSEKLNEALENYNKLKLYLDRFKTVGQNYLDYLSRNGISFLEKNNQNKSFTLNDRDMLNYKNLENLEKIYPINILFNLLSKNEDFRSWWAVIHKTSIDNLIDNKEISNNWFEKLNEVNNILKNSKLVNIDKKLEVLYDTKFDIFLEEEPDQFILSDIEKVDKKYTLKHVKKKENNREDLDLINLEKLDQIIKEEGIEKSEYIKHVIANLHLFYKKIDDEVELSGKKWFPLQTSWDVPVKYRKPINESSDEINKKIEVLNEIKKLIDKSENKKGEEALVEELKKNYVKIFKPMFEDYQNFILLTSKNHPMYINLILNAEGKKDLEKVSMNNTNKDEILKKFKEKMKKNYPDFESLLQYFCVANEWIEFSPGTEGE